MLRTDRLVLRRFADRDLPRFAALNADPEVMALFPKPLSPSETMQFMDRANREIDRLGMGLWALERDDGAFIGFCGVHHHDGDAYPFPCDEVGWRLHRDAWGHGFATEAAEGAIAHALDGGVGNIVSFTVPSNTRSRAVMERLGMTHDPSDDFDHPRLPADSPLLRHVLYRLDATRFRNERAHRRLYAVV